MFSATQVNQFAVYSSNRLLPQTGAVSNNRIGNSYGFQFPKEQGFSARETLRELLGSVGRNPGLVAGLAAKKSREEKVELLISHKLIASKDDLPIEKEVKEEMKCLLAFAAKREAVFEATQVLSACAMIGFGGSYEDEGA
jgi:hypothetical protein